MNQGCHDIQMRPFLICAQQYKLNFFRWQQIVSPILFPLFGFCNSIFTSPLNTKKHSVCMVYKIPLKLPKSPMFEFRHIGMPFVQDVIIQFKSKAQICEESFFHSTILVQNVGRSHVIIKLDNKPRTIISKSTSFVCMSVVLFEYHVSISHFFRDRILLWGVPRGKIKSHFFRKN